MPQFLSPDQDSKLVGIDRTTLRSMRKRGQRPAISRGGPSFLLAEVGAGVLPEKGEIDAEEQRGITPTQSFLQIVANAFHDRYSVSREVAAKIASRGFMALANPEWSAISASSAEVVAGNKPAVEIMFGVLEGPDDTVTFGAGPFSELIAARPDAIGVLLISLTRCAALMRQRSEEHSIDLGDFWEKA